MKRSPILIILFKIEDLFRFLFTGKAFRFKLSRQKILVTQRSHSHRFDLIFSIISAYSLSLSLV